MPDLVLCTLNARFSHASLGLRCLQANLGAYAARSSIIEFTLRTPLSRMLDALLADAPRIIGLGVYIWNVTETTRLVRALRLRAPGVKIVLGGPEVSHESAGQEIVRLADHVITGAADLALPRLVGQLLDGPRPLQKIIAGGDPDPETLQLPYSGYSDDDLRHRHLYVEASRGCPFKCEFCLSALDRTARAFPLAAFLGAMGELIARGARRFKFVDRTFNLKVSASLAILRFFRAAMRDHPNEPFFVHFELVPDHLPDALKAEIAAWPPGSLQFEIGIQTWNPAVQALISRRQDNARAEDNLRWLVAHSPAHLHVDLIAGLPGESLQSLAAGFDRLYALEPHEIQLGLLKRLRGAPIARHTETHGLVFSADPPYVVQETAALSARDLQRVARFARYWDLVANSGRLPASTKLLLGGQPFERFLAFSDWLHERLGSTYTIAFETLAEAVHRWLQQDRAASSDEITRVLAADYAGSGAHGHPAFLARGIGGGRPVARAAHGSWRQHRAGHQGKVSAHHEGASDLAPD